MTPFELQEAMDNANKRPVVYLAPTHMLIRELMLSRDDPQEFTSKEFNRDIKKSKVHLYQIRKSIKNLTDDNAFDPCFNLESTQVRMKDVKDEMLTRDLCLQMFPKQTALQKKEIDRDRKFIKNELQKLRNRDQSAQEKSNA